ncbi:metal-dependent hydrolase [Sneathiella marina]|uniref:Metal-dependent hydrolase n=1 Tax=Sneathiella marina TaxID=2950108 RepID=A0ABY4W405_9PROT|nr:metal-dependent hydrolase [Sneathiella marina]USG60848.1 metal-dependent hydrolase [Sneathiella marina]
MDSVTQFVLGASISGALLGPRIGAKSLLIGGLVATLPDLDSFIPLGNAIDDMTHHRGFSHSILVQTAFTPVIAFIIGKIAPSTWIHKKMLFFTVWLTLITHSLLDSLTTYGTQILWPLNAGPPIAHPSIFIIDPVYTLLLLAGVLTMFFARKTSGGGFRVNQILLAASSAYLAIGFAGNAVVASRAAADPVFQNMRIHVQPTPFNILLWQVSGISDDRFSTGLVSLIGNCGVENVISTSRQKSATRMLNVPASVKRLEWFTDGFYTYAEQDGKLSITDLRIGLYPSFPFSFEFAQEKNGLMVAKPPEKIALSYQDRASDIFGLMGDKLTGCSTVIEKDTADGN